MWKKSKNPRTSCKTLVANADFTGKSADCIVEEYSHNAAVDNGELCSLFGVEKVFNDGRKVRAYFECALGGVMCTDSGVFLNQIDAEHQICSAVFIHPAFLYCEKQGTLIISEKHVGTFTYRNQTWNRACEVGFSTLALAKERAFGCDGNILYHTDCDDYGTWHTVALPQAVQAVTGRGENIYAVGREIFKVEFSDNTPATVIKSVFRGVGDVYPRTVCTLGNRIMFLTPEGLFGFAYSKLQRYCAEICFDRDNAAAFAVCGNGYFLVCAERGAKGNSALIRVDATGNFVRYGIVPTHISCGSRLVMVDNGHPKYLCKQHGDLYWRSKRFCFGNAFVQKHLRKMFVDTANALDVHLVTEKERRIFHLDGGVHRVRLNGVCQGVTVEIYSQGEATVRALTLVAQTYGREVGYGADR